MAYERDIDKQRPDFLPTDVFLPPMRGSNANIVFTVVFATPKVLASSTAKFLSPLRGFVAPLSGAVSTVAFRGLRTLRVLAHGYEKSRPAGGYAAGGTPGGTPPAA